MSNAKPTPNPSQIRSSDAAQAVMDAYENSPQTGFCLGEQKALAAALRALADQVVPDEDWPDQSIGFADWNLATERCEQRKNIRAEILDRKSTRLNSSH